MSIILSLIASILCALVMFPYWRRWSVALWEWLTWAVPILWGVWTGDVERLIAAPPRGRKPQYHLIAAMERELGLTEHGATCGWCGRFNLPENDAAIIVCEQCGTIIQRREPQTVEEMMTGMSAQLLALQQRLDANAACLGAHKKSLAMSEAK